LTREQIKESEEDKAAAAKRKRAEDPYAQLPIPPSLKVLPTDSETTRDKKRKRVKAIKSTNRLRRLGMTFVVLCSCTALVISFRFVSFFFFAVWFSLLFDTNRYCRQS
jgi:hypothetical protein